MSLRPTPCEPHLRAAGYTGRVTTLLAISLALFAAIALAYAALLQHSGVNQREEDSTRFRVQEFARILRNRTWLLGLIVLILGNAANIIALAIAPVMVVQPIGAVALITAVILAVVHRGLALTRTIVLAVAACGLSLAAFVAVAAVIGRYEVHYGASAHRVAWIALVLTVVFGIIILVRNHPPQLLLIAGSGLVFATVATNVHIISNQFFDSGLGGITWFNAISLALAGIIGSWFVQAAYAAGPPEMVIAGLTVIDPIFAVLLGSIVLGEAMEASILQLVLMAVTGAIACWAVIALSRYHPDVVAKERQRMNDKYGTHPDEDDR